MMLDQVKQIARELRLFGVYESVERRSAEAVAGGWHPADLLRLILEDEKQARKNAVIKRLTTRANFRHCADLADWDTTFDRGINSARLKELSTLQFFHRQTNLMIYGKTGEGKTHLAIALGRLLCSEGVSCTFYPVNFLFEEIAASRAAGRYLDFVRGLSKSQNIILDDFGLRSLNHEEATALCDILEDRYQKGSVIMTSQVDANGWRTLFEDPVIAEAIIDRLINPSETVVLKGGSYRAKIQSKNLKMIDRK